MHHNNLDNHISDSPSSPVMSRRQGDELAPPGINEQPAPAMIMPPAPAMIMPPAPAMIMPQHNFNIPIEIDPNNHMYIMDDNEPFRHRRNVAALDNCNDIIYIMDEDEINRANERNRNNDPVTAPASNIMEYELGEVASGLCDPRRVRNIKDMLKYAAELSDGVPMSSREGLDNINISFDEEKKQFLSNALSNMTVNVQEELNNAMNILYDNNKPLNDHEFAFDVIAEYVDNIDYANDFEKLGGFHIFLPCFRSEYPTIRMKTAELVATLVQHNAHCQEKFMENPAYLSTVMSLVENDPNEEVRIKALGAVSSLVRHNVTIFWKFIENGGKDLIINALKAPIDKMQIKTVFIICSTCHMGNDVAEMYVDNGVVEIIISIIMGLKINFETHHHELFLSTLNQLIQMSPVKVKQICSSVEDFKSSLISLRDSYTDESKHQDEKDQILCLMGTLSL